MKQYLYIVLCYLVIGDKKMVEIENKEKKTVWTAKELKELLDKGKLPYIDDRDRYKIIEYKLFNEVERKLYRMR